MKKDQKNKKSSPRVSSETIRLLNASQLADAAGGISTGAQTCGKNICYLN